MTLADLVQAPNVTWDVPEERLTSRRHSELFRQGRWEVAVTYPNGETVTHTFSQWGSALAEIQGVVDVLPYAPIRVREVVTTDRINDPSKRLRPSPQPLRRRWKR